jgi:hypothetical protein
LRLGLAFAAAGNFWRFLDVDRSTVAKEAGAVERNGLAAIQAAGDFNKARCLLPT